MKPIRINNIEVRLYNITKTNRKFYDIVKWETNKYYGKLQEYLDNGYVESFLGYAVGKGGHNLSRSFFDTAETCYTVATIEKDNENCWYLKSCGDRICTLTDDDLKDFMEVYKKVDSKLNKHRA